MVIVHIVVEYFVFNLLFGGLVLSLFYINREQQIVDVKEFLLLIVFPVVGLGLWLSKRKRRLAKDGQTVLPKDYFFWKNFALVNGIFYVYLFWSAILLGHVGITGLLLDMFDVGISGNAGVAEFAIGFIGGLFWLFIYFIAFLFASFFTVILPFIFARDSERAHLARELKLAKSREQKPENEK